MSSPDLQRLQPLLQIYLQLGGGVLFGWLLGRSLPRWVPEWIGHFLFWVGVPISIITFLRGADLSGTIWLAPVASWVAIFLGAGLAWIWLHGGWRVLTRKMLEKRWQSVSRHPQAWKKSTQGSFLLASMVGNTGYLGFPVSLTLVGEKYFGWALFYDLLGTVPGAYGLGVLLAARFGKGRQDHERLIHSMVVNPALWSLGFGLIFRRVSLPDLAERGLQGFAWVAITLSLILIGMRLSQLESWTKVRQAAVSLGINMLLVPLLLGTILLQLGITGQPHLVLVLQMAMPPAFATLVLGEVFDLDQELAVTALAVGSIGLLVTLPIWLVLFSH